MTRSREILVATTILLLSAIFTFLYGGIVPLLPGLVSQPEPAGATALAGAAVAAAVGVWRQAAWGRWLGVVVGLVLLWRDVAFVASGEVVDAISVALDLILLVVLVRRWPTA